MAYLKGYPVKYRSAEGRVALACYTVEAEDLERTGWTRVEDEEREEEPELDGDEQEQDPEVEAAPEPAKDEPDAEVKDPADAEPEVEEIEVEIEEEPVVPTVEPAKDQESSFEFMTKPELLKWAMDRGVDLPNRLSKAELVAECEKLARG